MRVAFGRKIMFLRNTLFLTQKAMRNCWISTTVYLEVPLVDQGSKHGVVIMKAQVSDWAYAAGDKLKAIGLQDKQ
jgi:hypothetical protein